MSLLKRAWHISKIFDALKPYGVFITPSDGLTDERTKPEQVVTGWLSMALTGQDMGLDFRRK
jgi:hypothetical protein